MSFDPRITPARPDLAAASLKGKVEAQHFAEGVLRRVARGRMCLRRAPGHDAQMETELLFGETFTVYDTKESWAWGQCTLDGYVGYIHTIALADMGPAPDHRVTALSTPLLPAPDVKASYIDFLPMNAKVKVMGREKGFARLAAGYVWERHLASLDAHAPDWVAVAERFLGAPYVWGGKSAAGFDCSGLVQTALEAGGIAAPRDTDMQEAALGAPAPSGLGRGDLVFWKGHVGVMLDATRLLHANAFHMAVAAEPLCEAADRIAGSGGGITSVKRL